MRYPGIRRPVNARWIKRNFDRVQWRTQSRYKTWPDGRLLIRNPHMRPLLHKGGKP